MGPGERRIRLGVLGDEFFDVGLGRMGGVAGPASRSRVASTPINRLALTSSSSPESYGPNPVAMRHAFMAHGWFCAMATSGGVCGGSVVNASI